MVGRGHQIPHKRKHDIQHVIPQSTILTPCGDDLPFVWRSRQYTFQYGMGSIGPKRSIRGMIFNWAQILTNNIFCNAHEACINKTPSFYMATYLTDVIFSFVAFLGMKWNYNPNLQPIHIYYYELWECNYNNYFYEFFDDFLAPLFQIIFGRFLHRLSSKVVETLEDLVDWYMENNFTFIYIFGSSAPPDLLLGYVLNSLLGREIEYES
jgi:hypothetical protein